MKNEHLERRIANLARQNRDLRAELAMLRCTIKQKSLKNTRNLKWLAKIRATKKKGDKKVNLKVKKELEVTRGMLAAKVTQVKRLKEDAKKIDEEYGELEEKFTEARGENQEKNKPTEVLTTKQHSRYTNEIRTLYYQLLAQQLPPGKIECCIKTILSTFCPHMDLEHLQLPKASLAAHMRSLEMPTVSHVHQAHMLSEASEYHLNSDGTTLNQKKVQGMLVNGVVLGVKDVADGSAKTAVEELSQVLHNIKMVAKELKMKNADKIGWGLIKSCMSDQASTQKLFNSLVEERVAAKRDTAESVVTDSETVEAERDTAEGVATERDAEVLKIFCGIHLGVNL